jgi:hypothetical protein
MNNWLKAVVADDSCFREVDLSISIACLSLYQRARRNADPRRYPGNVSVLSFKVGAHLDLSRNRETKSLSRFALAQIASVGAILLATRLHPPIVLYLLHLLASQDLERK